MRGLGGEPGKAGQGTLGTGASSAKTEGSQHRAAGAQRSGEWSWRNGGGNPPGERVRPSGGQGHQGVEKGKYVREAPEVAPAGLGDGSSVGREAEGRSHRLAGGPDRHPGNQSEVDEREDN